MAPISALEMLSAGKKKFATAHKRPVPLGVAIERAVTTPRVIRPGPRTRCERKTAPRQQTPCPCCRACSHGTRHGRSSQDSRLLERTIQRCAVPRRLPNLSSRARPALEPQKAGTNRSQPITLLQYLCELSAERGARPLFLRARRRCQGKTSGRIFNGERRSTASLLGPSGERFTTAV